MGSDERIAEFWIALEELEKLKTRSKNMKKESWFIRFLKKIGLVKTYEVSKKEMCEQAKGICNNECESCAWHTQD